jgi:hypothetical protein
MLATGFGSNGGSNAQPALVVEKSTMLEACSCSQQAHKFLPTARLHRLETATSAMRTIRKESIF